MFDEHIPQVLRVEHPLLSLSNCLALSVFVSVCESVSWECMGVGHRWVCMNVSKISH